MEPISIILGALVAGAAAAGKEVAGKAVKDAYEGLKTFILRKFEARSDVEDALDKVEEDIESEARKALLKEELEKAGAAEDKEVLKQARSFLDLLNRHGLLEPSYQAMLQGDGAIAQGASAAAAGKGGVVVGGNVKGTIVTGNGNIRK